MKKKLYLIMATAITAFSLCACSSENSTDTTAPTTTAITGEAPTKAPDAVYDTLPDETIDKVEFDGNVYDSEDYSINLKKDFVKQETTGIDFFKIEGTNTQINVAKDTVGKLTTLDEYLTGLTETFDSIDGYDALSAGKIKVNGYDGIVINYKYNTGSDKTSTLYGRQIVLDCNGTFFALTYSTVDSDFEANEKAAMEMFSTFSAK